LRQTGDSFAQRSALGRGPNSGDVLGRRQTLAAVAELAGHRMIMIAEPQNWLVKRVVPVQLHLSTTERTAAEVAGMRPGHKILLSQQMLSG